jgi:hypothetical protein
MKPNRADLQFVEPFRKKLKQLNKNKQCVYPGCKNIPIGSHVITESVLKLLADKSKVLTWEHSEDEIIVNAIHGHEWDHVYKQPKSVGIETEVTYPIFCSEHDNDVFKALEKPGFSYEPHQVALLGYRALCYKTWNPNLEQKLALFLSNEDDKIVKRHFRLLSLQTFLDARQKFKDTLATQDYHQMGWIKRVFHIDPCFACTDAFIPYHGEEDVINIASGTTIPTLEDVITFTFFPERSLNASICIITWFRDNIRGERFRENLELGNPSEAKVRDKIITKALGMSLVYASQAWWDSLSPEQQKDIWELQLSEIKSQKDL